MINIKNIELITDDLKEYIAINMEITKLNIVAKTATVTASLMTSVVLAALAILAILFVSLGVALYLSGYKTVGFNGFAMIAGFYLILFVIVFLFKKIVLNNPFKDKIIRKLLSK